MLTLALVCLFLLLPVQALAANLDPGSDPFGYLLALYNAGKGHLWLLLGAVIVIGLVWTIRKYGGKIPKIGPYLTSGKGAVLTTIITTILLTVAAAIVDGVPVTLNLIFGAITAGLAAAGLYKAAKTATEPSADKKAEKTMDAITPVLGAIDADKKEALKKAILSAHK